MRKPQNKFALLALLLAAASIPLALAAQQSTKPQATKPQPAKTSTASTEKSPASNNTTATAATPTAPGNESCAKCHSAIADSYPQTAMARASGPATDQLIPADFTHA